MDLTVSLIYGSVRTERQGIRAVRYLEKRLNERRIKVNLIDPMIDRLPFLDKMHKEYPPGEAPEMMESISKRLDESDGFLIVTGEYNHSVPPALKNLLDHFQREYLFKPSAIACYSAGQFGGMRAAVHLRAIVGELGMPAISSLLSFPSIKETVDEAGNLIEGRLEKGANRFLDEFVWVMEALKVKREEGWPF